MRVVSEARGTPLQYAIIRQELMEVGWYRVTRSSGPMICPRRQGSPRPILGVDLERGGVVRLELAAREHLTSPHSQQL